MSQPFPRTTVGGVSLSRLIIGTNWLLGFSHRSPAADCLIRRRNGTPDAIAELLEVFLNAGVDTTMGLFAGNALIMDAVHKAEDRTGRKLILIDTPVLNMDDNATARKEAEATIARCRQAGATFCYPHHSSAEQLVNKNRRTMDRLPDYLKMIRDQGMIPGLSAHMPELIIYSDLNGYDVESYVQIFNCMGFLMQVEVEYIHKVIWGAKKPVMTIKPMAAGRVTPFVGLTFSWNAIRPCDMITVGCLTPEEAAEDIEISLAALEHRPPNLQGRNSPNKTAVMKD
jgi:hypothetical protein